MSERADAHIHLFEKGYGAGLTAKPGVRIDEAVLYDALRAEQGIGCALVVGYEGHDWAAGNNAYLARLVQRYDWIAPVAYVDVTAPPDEGTLGAWRDQGFVGNSLYVFNEEQVEALRRVPDTTWRWLAERRWLISVNSKGPALSAWSPILEKHGELRLLISHLGLPQPAKAPPSPDAARASLADVLKLSSHPGVHVKLSAFYAVTDPGHAYPHQASEPYVRALFEALGARRLVWGSDFPPCLEFLSFSQARDVLDHMVFLGAEDRRAIEGGNLLGLLKAAREG